MIYTPQAVFGRLTLLTQTSTGRRARWDCQCSCGARKSVRQDHLASGMTKSCGCLRAKSHAIAMSVALKGGL